MLHVDFSCRNESQIFRLNGISSLSSVAISQFHQHFTYERCFGTFSLVACMYKKLPKRRLYEKFVDLTLMKLTPGLSEREEPA